MIGERLGRWVIEAEIGRGAMGRVYRARDAADPDRKAAVKVLGEAAAREPSFQQRFRAEIDILRRLDHPHIVKLIDSGVHDGTPYYVMEYVDGPDFETLLRNGRKLAWQDVLDVALQVTSALRHAHQRGVIHRDLKPSNLLRAPDGSVKLTDFGIAKLFGQPNLTAAGSVVGTVAYLSPEQAAGKPVTKRSDFYALGGVLYTLLTGRPPFTGGNVVELLHKHCFTQPERPARLVPDLPHDIDELVCQLLAKDPAQRPGDGSVLKKELERIRGKLERKGLLDRPRFVLPDDTDTRPALPPDAGNEAEDEAEEIPAREPWYRHKAVRAAVLLAGLLMCVGGIAWKFGRGRPGADELYAAAAPLLASDNPADWDRAWNEYLEPLQRYHPNRYKDEVREAKQRIDDQAELRRAFVQGRVARPAGEAERFYLEGLRAVHTGDFATARRVWNELIRAFNVLESEQRWVRLARQGLERLDEAEASHRQPTGPRPPESVRRALEEARRLRAAGKSADADAVLQGLETLYRDDPDVMAAIRRKDEG